MAKQFLKLLSATSAALLYGLAASYSANDFHTDQLNNDGSICNGVDLNAHRSAEPSERIAACNRMLATGGTPSGILSKYPDADQSNLKYIDDGYTPNIRARRAEALIIMHRYQDALDDLNYYFSYLSQHSPTPKSFSQSDIKRFRERRAMANYSLAHYQDALVDMEGGFCCDTGDIQYITGLNLRADIELQVGRYAEAATHYGLFMQKSPYYNPKDYPQVRENLITARRLADNPGLPSPPPTKLPMPTPDNPSPACKLYPNLC